MTTDDRQPPDPALAEAVRCHPDHPDYPPLDCGRIRLVAPEPNKRAVAGAAWAPSSDAPKRWMALIRTRAREDNEGWSLVVRPESPPRRHEPPRDLGWFWYVHGPCGCRLASGSELSQEGAQAAAERAFSDLTLAARGPSAGDLPTLRKLADALAGNAGTARLHAKRACEIAGSYNGPNNEPMGLFHALEAHANDLDRLAERVRELVDASETCNRFDDREMPAVDGIVAGKQLARAERRSTPLDVLTERLDSLVRALANSNMKIDRLTGAVDILAHEFIQNTSNEDAATDLDNAWNAGPGATASLSKGDE